ncbi:MAG: helix-turn-helix domain-containing protein [Burkholderiales bacterium]|nr:helix-turn-helix domain-containing protein [Pseudomonadota bacterium]MCC7067041.1 helix-turn-helix domain-containing protein [Burkholderiales bacterium]
MHPHLPQSAPRINAPANAAAGARSPSARDAVLEQVIALGRARVVTEGTAIHRAGDPFRSVFYMKSGAAKRMLIQEDGREQILGFPMPGDLVGMEAIDAGSHTTTVVALDLCAVIEIPFEALEACAAENPAVARFLYHRMSAALRDEHGWLAALGLLNADERVAAFLLDLSQRFAARGFSARRFMLRMTRAEIGSFLGLTLETVSRVFSRFQKLGLLKVTRRDIELLDMDALSSLAHSHTLH